MGDGHGEITHLLRQQRGSTVYGPSFILWTYVLLPHAHRQGATTKLIDFSSVQRERKSGDFSPLCGASFSMPRSSYFLVSKQLALVLLPAFGTGMCRWGREERRRTRHAPYKCNSDGGRWGGGGVLAKPREGKSKKRLYTEESALEGYCILFVKGN